MVLSAAVVLSIGALSAVSSALPTSSKVLARAGAPSISPIPATCRVTSPLPASADSTSTTTYQPGPSTDNDMLYTAYYPAFSTNKTAMAQQCLEQCYGYGTHVECKTAYWAENLVVPAGYRGGPGDSLSTGCLMFSRALTTEDFVQAPAGQATDAFAGDIAC
ncbi:hypothetical protein ACEQ8H_006933 [Pleosporales sp. CAS-2024a]